MNKIQKYCYQKYAQVLLLGDFSEKFVKEIIENPNINIGYLEKQIYKYIMVLKENEVFSSSITRNINMFYNILIENNIPSREYSKIKAAVDFKCVEDDKTFIYRIAGEDMKVYAAIDNGVEDILKEANDREFISHMKRLLNLSITILNTHLGKENNLCNAMNPTQFKFIEKYFVEDPYYFESIYGMLKECPELMEDGIFKFRVLHTLKETKTFSQTFKRLSGKTDMNDIMLADYYQKRILVGEYYDSDKQGKHR